MSHGPFSAWAMRHGPIPRSDFRVPAPAPESGNSFPHHANGTQRRLKFFSGSTLTRLSPGGLSPHPRSESVVNRAHHAIGASRSLVPDVENSQSPNNGAFLHLDVDCRRRIVPRTAPATRIREGIARDGARRTAWVRAGTREDGTGYVKGAPSRAIWRGKMARFSEIILPRAEPRGDGAGQVNSGRGGRGVHKLHAG